MTDRKAWIICLITAGASAVILGGARLLGIALPDMLVRVIGVIDLILVAAIGVLIGKHFRK